MLLRASRDADLIYALDPWSVGVPSLLVAALFRKTFVVKIVGDYAWEQGVQRFGVRQQLDTFSKRPGSDYHPFVSLLKFSERLVARRAKRVVVPSEYLKTIISNWGVSKKRITVIHNGIRDFDVRGRKQVLRGMVKARGEILISAGRLVPWKGFAALIAVMPVLLKRFPEAKLLIAGDGPDMNKLEHAARRLGISGHVVFLGSLSQDVLMSYIKMADVFVLNSSYEGFSHVLLEVMAVGTPIVTTNVGGNPEIISDQKHGILIRRNSPKELSEAISRTLSDRGLRERIARAAKRRVKDFSEEHVIRETAEFLNSIV